MGAHRRERSEHLYFEPINLSSSASDSRLVLVRQAVFQTLCSPDFLDIPTLGPGIILTGKGYPDVSTRELVLRLSRELPRSAASSLSASPRLTC